jgi:hypothetical protein
MRKIPRRMRAGARKIQAAIASLSSNWGKEGRNL